MVTFVSRFPANAGAPMDVTLSGSDISVSASSAIANDVAGHVLIVLNL